MSWCLCLTITFAIAGRVPVSAHDGVPEQIAALSARIAQQPLNADLLVRRADLYRLERKWTEALADLDRAGNLAASPVASGLVRARLMFDKADWLSAARASSGVLDRQPGHAEALLIRARARMKLGMRNDAVADFTAALAARPVPDVYLERARAIRGATPASIEASLGSLDEGIARIGQVVTLELEAIDLELRLRRYDAALARLDVLAAQSPRKESWLARRGAILEQAGRPNEARASYRAALAAANAPAANIRPTRMSRDLIQQVNADLARLEAGAAHSGGTRDRQ